jgi:hypothetical protein
VDSGLYEATRSKQRSCWLIQECCEINFGQKLIFPRQNLFKEEEHCPVVSRSLQIFGSLTIPCFFSFFSLEVVLPAG